jgi:exosome complex component RRP46
MTVTLQTRPDTRSTQQIRPFLSQQSVLTGPDGSAKFSFGPSSSCLVSITGPIEASLRDELMDRALVTVQFKPLIGHTGTQHTLYEKLLTDVANHVILTSLFPRTVIQVYTTL